MNTSVLRRLWTAPQIPAGIAHGDMPGDVICIGEEHIRKAETLFPPLKAMAADQIEKNPNGRAVVSVCGGSGVGKSEIASILAYYFGEMGVGAYTLSGDNYPRRIPMDNDAERLRVFRTGGLRGLVASGVYDLRMADALRALWAREADADMGVFAEYPWMEIYRKAGYGALMGYLGTKAEIDFDEVSAIIAQFKRGAQSLMLKRMGRERGALWYEPVDLSGVQVLVIEWTHGNSDLLEGVDIPVLLNSTPQETLAHRMARNRDGRIDSAFTTMVLEIEQRKLDSQAWRAGLILSKAGELMDYAAYRRAMADA
ncbi:MAG: adenylylsulfate kinase [Clostridia bacterium]|nr:adenylylsulfate kinase [Clostridia bacterium]